MTTTTERTLWQKWVHFWFAAADPTTMAFIRIVTGVLVLYVHLVYSLDLYSFFGKDAWYGLEIANRERHETPWQANSFWDWEWKEYPKNARLPEEPHRRVAVLAYLQSLPYDKPEQLERGIRLLDCEADAIRDSKKENQKYPVGRVAPPGYDLLVRELITFCDARPTSPLHPVLTIKPEARELVLAELKKPKDPNNRERYLTMFDRLTEEQRKEKAQQLEDFFLMLPHADANEKDPKKQAAIADQRQFVVEYFLELGPAYRMNLLRFIRELVPLSEAERTERLDYLGYWNTEKQFSLRTGSPVFSIWYHITDPTEMAIAHSAIIIIIILFTIGWQTRITSILTWLAAMSYLNRNPQVLFGQDTMMNILLIYLMIANSGAALSVDRWLACKRARKLAMQKHGKIDAETAAYLATPMPSVSSGFAQRMLQIHFCFIYMAAGMSKLKGNAWWNHNAFWDTLINPEFTMIHFQWYEHLMRYTASSRPVYAAVAAGGVWFTIFIEISLPFLVWTKLRPWAVMMGLALHAGVGVFMGLLIFSLFMMTMLLCYIPGSAVRQVLFSEKR